MLISVPSLVGRKVTEGTNMSEGRMGMPILYRAAARSRRDVDE